MISREKRKLAKRGGAGIRMIYDTISYILDLIMIRYKKAMDMWRQSIFF
jgi:hypothetical protein